MQRYLCHRAILALVLVTAVAGARGEEIAPPSLLVGADHSVPETAPSAQPPVDSSRAPSAEPEDLGAPAASEDSARVCPPVDWTKVPPVRPIARPGEFLVAPTAPGYFSLLDQLRGDYREKSPILPYGIQGDTIGPSFDIDYRYLDDPRNTQHNYWDRLKRIHRGDDWLLSLGGNTRVRLMHEVDSRLGVLENNDTLFRTRLHGDLWYRDSFRLYTEGIFADAYDYDLPPGPRDINRGDFLDLFVDLKVFESDDGTTYFRGGRQEVTYGSRRLLGSRTWGNARASWDGAKAFYLGADWDFDIFWFQPVIVHSVSFDAPDRHQNLYGLWSTRKLGKGTGWDFYYLGSDNTHDAAVGRDAVRGPFSVHTLGTRTWGNKESWLWDVETMLQLGSWSNQDKLAGAVAVAGGYAFAELPTQPQLWCGYDWASGTNRPGQGAANHTFYQIFPAVHYYFGSLDLVARENIRDLHGQIAFYPENWVTTIIQLHHFELDSARDALYNAQGAPIRRDPSGAAGRNVGDELDIQIHARLTTYSSLLVGWSKLFSGPFIAATGPDVSPELFYGQYNYRW